MKAKFGQSNMENYENKSLIYSDLKGVIDTAFDEGKMEGKIEVAIALNKKGLSIHEISELSELPEDEIRKVLK